MIWICLKGVMPCNMAAIRKEKKQQMWEGAKGMADEFYLLDLERTIGMGRPFFWKRSRYGYTDALKMAGIFSRKEAEKIAQLDLDNKTILIDKTIVQRIFGKDLIYEYTTP
jgi:hypothetical protein